MDQVNYNRGLIIVYPYGTYIRKREKNIIVKTRLIKSIIDQNLLLIENKLGLGIIQLGFPKKINLDQFRKLSKRHMITNEDRIKWWAKYTELYSYPINKTKFFRTPLILDYPQGPQITVNPENIFINKILVGMSGYYYKYMYPKKVKNLLDYYSQNLNSVEINSTFYNFPPESSIKNLKKYNLFYSIKVHRYITHMKKLKGVKSFWNNFYNAFGPIHDKIFCFLFQFSPRFIYNNKNFIRLVKLSEYLNKAHRYAFEFRELGWFNNENITKLFKENNWTLVISNINNTKSWAGNLLDGYNPSFNNYEITSDAIYIRMHGSMGQYWGSYTNTDFKKIFNFIADSRIKYGLIYFNNTDRHASAMIDAIELTKKFNYINTFWTS